MLHIEQRSKGVEVAQVDEFAPQQCYQDQTAPRPSPDEVVGPPPS